MKIAPGYASLPACFASVKDRFRKTEHAGSDAYPGISGGK